MLMLLAAMNKLKVYLKSLSAAVLIASLAGLFSPWSVALPSDNEQAIHIKANSAIHDDRKGVTVYTGDVIISQGSLMIKADIVIIHKNKNNEIDRIVSTGKPAHLQQQPDTDEDIVHARGEKIRYFLDRELVQLIGNASLVQEGSTVISEQIDYYIKEQKVKAQGSPKDPEQGEKPSKRVEVVIPPRKDL